MNNALETATKITGPCTCHEAYKIRGLIAPDCVYHDIADDIAKALQAARAAALEEAANFLKARANTWHREAELHTHGPVGPGNVPAGWLRFKIKATEASECANLVRAMKETE